MALLDLVNDLRDLLREERVTSVAGSAPDLLVQVGLVNRAARRLLARRAWSFMQRNDGRLLFPAKVDLTSVIATNGGTGAFLFLSTTNVNRYAGRGLLARLYRPDDANFPDTSYPVTNIASSGGTAATLSNTYEGETISGGTMTLFSMEARFPSTVSRVISIRNSEGVPLRFETIDSEDDFDRWFPRYTERFGSDPDYVAVGGFVTPTSKDSAAVDSGLGVRIYPPPDEDVLLQYSYTRRPNTLASDTDGLTGVPQEVQDLIVRMAFQEALSGNIEDDPQRAERMLIENERQYRDLASADNRDMGRRHIPTPFGADPSARRHVESRRLESP